MMKKQLNWLFDYPNLKIYQYQEGFKFSLDSILLAEFATIRKSDEKILDLCTGNGVIPILLHFRYQKNIVGVELQKEIASLARDSVKENGMEDAISIIEDNVLELKNYFPGNNFDVVLSNPPYFKFHHPNFVNQNSLKSIARHEVTICLEQLIEMASYLLKNKGRFYLVHIPERLDEIIVYANKYGFGIKKMQFIYSKTSEPPIIVLVALVKNGRFGCRICPPLSIEGVESYQNLFKN